MPDNLTHTPPAISVDVEDWPQSTWDRTLPITQRSADNVRSLVRLLRDLRVSATMFVLGKFAEKFPEVVREIRADGHEVACHGYGHVEIFKQSRKEFAEDVRRSKDLLEQIVGERVTGYRAPDFSIIRSTLWALEVLAEAGFEYDSSIYPVRQPRYGIPDWPAGPVRVEVSGTGSLIECPIGTYRFLGKNWPVGGGGYHRLLPGRMSRYFAKKAMHSTPFVFYCHPYEFDSKEFGEMRIPIPWRVRLHQGLGRGRFKKRFEAFVTQFGGRRIDELLSAQEWPRVSLAGSADGVLGESHLSATESGRIPAGRATFWGPTTGDRDEEGRAAR